MGASWELGRRQNRLLHDCGAPGHECSSGACVSTSLDGMCVAGSIKGRVDLQFTAKKGQSITLYVRNYDASRGGTLHGKVTVTVGGPEVALGTITLR